jgi:hypothetical protein
MYPAFAVSLQPLARTGLRYALSTHSLLACTLTALPADSPVLAPSRAQPDEGCS